MVLQRDTGPTLSMVLLTAAIDSNRIGRLRTSSDEESAR